MSLIIILTSATLNPGISASLSLTSRSSQIQLALAWTAESGETLWGTGPRQATHIAQLRPSAPLVHWRAFSPINRTCWLGLLTKDCMNLYTLATCWSAKDRPCTISGSSCLWVVYGILRVLLMALFHSVFICLACLLSRECQSCRSLPMWARHVGPSAKYQCKYKLKPTFWVRQVGL